MGREKGYLLAFSIFCYGCRILLVIINFNWKQIGNLSTNFMVNGFNGYYFYLIWWLMLGLIKLGTKLYLRGLTGKEVLVKLTDIDQ